MYHPFQFINTIQYNTSNAFYTDKSQQGDRERERAKCVNSTIPEIVIVEKMSKETARQKAKQYLSEGLFPPRSMGAKIEAAVEFVEQDGERAVVCMPARVYR